MKRAWLWFIRRTLNHLTLAIARSRLGPFAIVRVAGRRTGIVRDTPIVAAPIDGGFMLELTYGSDVQWYRNVRAAGGCVIVRHRSEHRIIRVEEVDTATGLAAFGPAAQGLLRMLRREHFVRFLEAA